MKKNYALPLLAVGYIIIFTALQVSIQSCVLLYEYFSHGSKTLTAVESIIYMAIFSILGITLFAWRKWSPINRDFIQSRPWDVLFWSFLASIGAILPSAYLQELMPEWPATIQNYINEMSMQLLNIMNTPGGYAVLCLLAPVAEEMVFRGAALRVLLSWKPQRPWLMITLSALFFALAHMNPAQLIHPFLIGLLLGWMYMRTGSILPGIIYHWANNTAAYLTTRIYQDPDITLTQIFGSTSHTLMAVMFSLLIILPALFQLNQRMKR